MLWKACSSRKAGKHMLATYVLCKLYFVQTDPSTFQDGGHKLASIFSFQKSKKSGSTLRINIPSSLITVGNDSIVTSW